MTVVNRSGNEVYGLVTKAMRGAGLPLAAGVLAGRTLQCGASDAVLRELASFLETTANGPVVTTGQGLQVSQGNLFRDGPIILDALRAGVLDVTLGPVGTPDYTKLFARVHGVSVTHDPACGLRFERCDPAMATAQRCDISAATWSRLNHFAKKTYVPETEESRLAGAGAGLTDND